MSMRRPHDVTEYPAPTGCLAGRLAAWTWTPCWVGCMSWGQVAAMALVPAVVDAAQLVLVIAAGGIGDGRGLAAVLALGAQAGWLGTRFLTAPEAATHDLYRHRVLAAAPAAAPAAALYTRCFDCGWPDVPHRAIRNSTIDAWEAASCPPAQAVQGRARWWPPTAMAAPSCAMGTYPHARHDRRAGGHGPVRRPVRGLDPRDSPGRPDRGRSRYPGSPDPSPRQRPQALLNRQLPPAGRGTGMRRQDEGLGRWIDRHHRGPPGPGAHERCPAGRGRRAHRGRGHPRAHRAETATGAPRRHGPDQRPAHSRHGPPPGGSQDPRRSSLRHPVYGLRVRLRGLGDKPCSAPAGPRHGYEVVDVVTLNESKASRIRGDGEDGRHGIAQRNRRRVLDNGSLGRWGGRRSSTASRSST